jgi:predicted kinase
MEPIGQGAQCPSCGSRVGGVARAPLFVVTGASGSGKTAILAPLASALAAECVTFDADGLLDAAGALSHGQPIDWAAFHAALLAFAHGVAQSGRPTVLLAPLGPGTLESLAARRWIGDIRYLVLDCPDDVRRQRMAARPPWRLHDVEEQVSWGRWLRVNVPDRVDTSHGTPADCAAAVASWVLRHLGPAASFPVD